MSSARHRRQEVVQSVREETPKVLDRIQLGAGNNFEVPTDYTDGLKWELVRRYKHTRARNAAAGPHLLFGTDALLQRRKDIQEKKHKK